MSGNKWSVDRTIKFLEIYEQHPCLWDIRSDSYKNREIRREAYEKIARAMALDDFGVLDVRSKIRTLRNSYTLELAKLLKLQRSNLSDETFTSRLAWFPVAERFFSKVARSQSTEMDTRLLSEHKHSTDSFNKFGQCTLTSSSKDQRFSAIMPPMLQERSSALLQRSSQEKSCITLPPPLLEKSPREDNETEYHYHGMSTKSSSLFSKDDYDVFGAFVASELRALDNTPIVRSTKKKIQTAILEAYEVPAPILATPVLETIDEQQAEMATQTIHMDSVQMKTEYGDADDDPIFSAINCSIVTDETNELVQQNMKQAQCAS